jgi:hypothetical protein
MKPGDAALQLVRLLDPMQQRNRLKNYSLSNEKTRRIHMRSACPLNRLAKELLG